MDAADTSPADPPPPNGSKSAGSETAGNETAGNETGPSESRYDEFGLFHENIAEFDLEVATVPPVERVSVDLPADPGRRVSALRWGTGPPEVVFVHGGAQNAHTWDTVALALGRPALAIDLPGHGHSAWRDDGAYTPHNLADDVAVMVAEHAPEARVVVGMSLGGLTSMELAVRHPALVRRLVLVDITPGVNQQKAKAVLDFVDGPQEFASFDELLERTMSFNPTRSESSMRRGILHNAAQHPDGSWQWRYDRSSHARSRDVGDTNETGPATSPETSPETAAETDAARGSETGSDAERGSVSAMAEVMSPMWEDFGEVAVPLTLVRGSTSPVVDDDDVAEARRRQPEIDVRVIEGAGHSVQGDRPVELAIVVEELLA